MLDLIKPFENWFDDPEITPERLKTFTMDHLARLAANNPANAYNTIITDTQTAVTALDNAITNKGSQTSEREGTTFTKEQARDAFQAFISQKEGTIKGIFGKPSQAYEEFFPQGVSAYRKATDAAFGNMADTAVLKAVKYQVELGAQFVTDITALRDAYQTAKANQDTDVGDVSEARTGEEIAVHDLEVQLCVNVHTLALNMLGSGDPNPEMMVETYFDESLLFAQHRKHIFKGGVAPHTEQPVCSFTYHATDHFVLEHKSAQPLNWQMMLNNVPVGNVFTTHIGEKLDKAFADFAADGDTLVVRNDEDVDGQYRVVELT